MYDIPTMWNLKRNDTNELTYKTETDLQTWRNAINILNQNVNFFFFGCAKWLAGSKSPKQEVNSRSESTKSQHLTSISPKCQIFDIQKFLKSKYS